MKKYFLTSVAIVLISTFGFSQELITDRPDQTESSSTVPANSLQIESGMLLQFNDDFTGNYRSFVAPTTLFRYGIASWIELRIVSQFESNKFNEISTKGISDLEIGTKIQLLKKENINTEIAFLSHLVLPSGSDHLSSRKYGSVNKLSISHVLTEHSSVGYNVGFNYFGENKGDITYSLAYGVSVTDKVGVYLEPFGEIVDLKYHSANFDAGFTYLARPNLQFDFSFGFGISHKMNYLSAGVSWLVVRK
ncbi:transporter [Flavobacteriales bacterium]|nr:transporter [Flavobacteriales bacterium]